jgi:large subunit ribosomal protein L19
MTEDKNSKEKKPKIATPVSKNTAQIDNINREDLKPGMTIRVYQKIKELNIKGEEKERVQYFEGMIIAKKHGKEKGATITVRKISDGVGVEKIFPLNLPTIDKITVKKQARVRRSKLYFLRDNYKKKFKEVKTA